MFINFGNFDEDFWPRTYEDKFWFFKIQREGFCCQGCSYSYVHHFGNITSDGPGFCFPDMAKRNEEKYKEKIKIFDENKIKQIINELPRQ
jgi:hypothetical protein